MPITRSWQRDLDQLEAERMGQGLGQQTKGLAERGVSRTSSAPDSSHLDAVNEAAQAALDAIQQERETAAWSRVGELLHRLRAEQAREVAS